MVRKEECPACKGDRVRRIKRPDGSPVVKQCPECGGQGYKVRFVRP